MNVERAALLPCPFCGGASIACESPRKTSWRVMCHADCDIFGDFDTREEAIAAWNRRTALPSESLATEFDANVERLKACEHIADGDEGWEKLRELCPSTAAVARLRDRLSTKQEDGPLREALENARIDFACIADYAGATDGIKHVAQSAIREINAALLSTKQEGEGKAIADLREESLRQGIIKRGPNEAKDNDPSAVCTSSQATQEGEVSQAGLIAAVQAACVVDKRRDAQCRYPECDCKTFPRRIIKAIRAFKQEADGWRTIDSAPKDGTEVIGCYFQDWGNGSVSIYGPWTIAFDGKKWRSSWDGSQVIDYMSDFGTDYKEPDVEPSHWHPLPAPPSPTQED